MTCNAWQHQDGKSTNFKQRNFSQASENGGHIQAYVAFLQMNRFER